MALEVVLFIVLFPVHYIMSIAFSQVLEFIVGTEGKGHEHLTPACPPRLDSVFYITYNSTSKFMSMADFV